MSDHSDRNKANAQAYYALKFNQGDPRTTIERDVESAYIQHFPHVANDKGCTGYSETVQ